MSEANEKYWKEKMEEFKGRAKSKCPKATYTLTLKPIANVLNNMYMLQPTCD